MLALRVEKPAQQSMLSPRCGPARMRPLLAALGDPQLAVPAIHVTGTNGKGSVCVMLSAILRAAGYRTARYTSPHLESCTERFWFDGNCLALPALENLLGEVRLVAKRIEEKGAAPGSYTQFDLLTAAFLLECASQAPELAVVEAGIGGQGDATNVFEAPLLTIITNIALEHVDMLGNDETAIALEKAGIIKVNRPVLTQAVGNAYHALAAVSKSRRAKLHHVSIASYVSPLPAGQRIGFNGRMWDLSLLGTYQLQNVAIVLEAVERLRAEGWMITDEAVALGLATVTWPGRMEFQQGGEQRWLFDGAHNPAGVLELVASLKRHYPGEEVVIVFGVLESKAGARMLEIIAPFAQTIFLTAPPSNRAMSPEQLAGKQRHPDLRLVPDPQEALASAVRAAQGRLIVVCGSLYLVGLARALLRNS